MAVSVYGGFVYGDAHYGQFGFPVSTTFDIYDFCYPSDSAMLSLFSFSETTSARTFGVPNIYFDYGDNDLIMLSDDGLDSGFRIELNVTNEFSVQFATRLDQLPADFSDTTNKRIFVAAYNRYGKMIGILLSENEGVALAQTGTGPYTVLLDSADLFSQSTSDYYVFRITADPTTGRGNLFITRQDLVPIIGHQLRYTFNLLDAPTGIIDQTLIEVVGTSGDPTEVRIDCWRLASAERMPNLRPIAIAGDDQTLVLGGYAGFDGRDSYDLNGDDIVQHWWTLVGAPDGSDLLVEGTGNTPADVTGYTNVINAITVGDFNDVLIGDLLYVGSSGSVVKYVSDTQIVVVDHVFPAGVSSASWAAVLQEGWGGARTIGSVIPLLGIETTPPVASDGDSYLVGTGAVGLWAGEDDKIAVWDAISPGTWNFTSPSDSDIIYVIADKLNRRYINGNYPAGQWELGDPYPWELDRWSGRELLIGSLLPPSGGLYTIELVVQDDGLVSGGAPLISLPAEVLLNVNATQVPFGVIKDMSWIWNYLPDMWNLVSDKDKITTTWSAFTQVAAGLLLELWQHDYGKALLDIQRIFQKKWLHYSPLFEESNFDTLPATIFNDVSEAGYSAAPGTNEYSYDLGAIPTGTITSDYLLILNGVGYRIVSVLGQIVITKDAIPVTDRPVFWQARPTVLSGVTNFDYERIGAEDVAIFEIVDVNGHSSDEEAYVYGAKLDRLAFDDSQVSAYIASPDYSVRFKSVLRRGGIRLNDYIVGVPRLQEVINRNAVEGAPGYLHENLDYFVEEESANDLSVNTLRFRNAWTQRVGFGYDGDTTAGPQYFDSLSSDFSALLGEVGTDLSNYVLELPSGRYRLYQLISETRLELEAEALGPASGLEFTVRRIDDPPQYLWAETTYVDNRPTIESNFGRLVGFKTEDLATRTDDLDYLSAVRGLWYTFWFGPTPYNIRVGSQILLGLPFAEQLGTIVDIQSPFDTTRSRILIQDADNDSIIRSYFYPTILGLETNEDTGEDYALGDTVEQFAPLCGGVSILDSLIDENWFRIFVGSGDFFELWKTHTFGIVVDSAAFDVTNLEFVISYILKIKPHYTYPWFVVSQQFQELITVDDKFIQGPYVPVGVELPDAWDSYQTPFGWSDSPWESKVIRVTTPTFDATTRWPNDRFVSAHRSTEFGGLHLTDTPGRIPDPQLGTIAQGAHVLDDTDESGNVIHVLDSESYASDASTDGDMELVGVANWPDLPSGGPTIKTKSGVFYAGAQSLEISDSGALMGCYQDLPASPTPTQIERYQVAFRCKVRVESGQARFRIRNQGVLPGPVYSYVAEVRRGWAGPAVWQDVVMHVWAMTGTSDEVRFEIMTGQAGGHFYVDAVETYSKAVPWDQWALDRVYRDRTGGYTIGGSPDEWLEMQIAGEIP